MASQAQITANRANAQLSTGPCTLEGKRNSAANPVTHGLRGRHVVLPGEDPAAFGLLLQQLRDEILPAGLIESNLVEELARYQWKLDRIRAVEIELLSLLLEPGSFTPSPLASLFLARSTPTDALKLISRYETSASNAYHRALRQLLAIQSQRRRDAARTAALEAKQDRVRSRDILRKVADIAFGVPNQTNPIHPDLPPAQQLESLLHNTVQQDAMEGNSLF